ncbi:MAG: 30S ribosomal protein S7 [Candidatus Aenigmarchaeota archaeon]|nr:30S ribosomal protein S7 [Candidatus Aenigmarchaeota archaeon]
MRRKTEKIKKFRKRQTAKKEREKIKIDVKLFGRWDSNIEVRDPSLKGYLNVDARILPRSAGRHRKPFHKSKMHIIERLALHLMVPGHTGRKHKITSGTFGGQLYNSLRSVEQTLEIIEKKVADVNPVEVVVRAIENSALTEEIISYQMGSIMAREAVVTSPQRRIDKTLRFFAQGAYRKSFNTKKSISEALADEIIAAYNSSTDSTAVREKQRIEREAAGAR